jgi:4-hydroxythreonine-4-phosphate dehydrogenase
MKRLSGGPRSETPSIILADLNPLDPHRDWGTGRPGRGSGFLAFEALRLAVEAIRRHGTAGLLTAPISKEWISRVTGRDFPGHTDYLAESFGREVLMLMHGPHFSVIPLTMHIPLVRVVPELRRVIERPALLANLLSLMKLNGYSGGLFAMCGINPHAGEGGVLGTEEIEFLNHKCEQWRGAGLPLEGPIPADAAFLEESRCRYRLILCAYHDQALIPFKAIEGRWGVNCTIGLPFLRTSPDHGTAFSIAGQGLADPTSIIEAHRLLASPELQIRNPAG